MRYVPIIPILLSLASCGSGASPGMSLAPPSGSQSIAEIQGSGFSSPLVGQSVTITAVVSGDFQENDADEASNLGGFFIQAEKPDADDSTSDGIFVFDGNDPATDVNVGDRVTVTGTVKEYFGETQIVDPRIEVIGSGAIAATDIALPVATTMTNSDGRLIAELERYEGMLLRFTQPLSVTNLRNLERFGSVGLSQGGRLYQFTNTNAPGTTGYEAHKAANARRSIALDDGRRTENPAPVRFLEAGITPGYSIRNGDTIVGLTGNLRYSRGSGGSGDEVWRLVPTVEPRFDSINPRPDVPAVDGNVRIASFNVLNFFSTIDSGPDICGPMKNEGCRGADSAREQARQLAKAVSALALMNADIVGLIELENNDNEALQMIVDALNNRIGTNEYAFVKTGAIHSDTIKTGFIYKSSTIRLLGAFAILDADVDARFDDNRNRPALAQTFGVESTGAALTVAVNHLKSKGSACDADADPNLGDGQGNCNRARTSAAAAIAAWLATDPTGSNDPDFLVIGDLNAYVREDPLVALQHAGFTNLLDTDGNPYSFVFDAQAGALDHALASPSLLSQVVATIEWHINADEPALLDYNLENGRDPALFNPASPYRSSDHDPLIIGLDLSN